MQPDSLEYKKLCKINLFIMFGFAISFGVLYFFQENIYQALAVVLSGTLPGIAVFVLRNKLNARIKALIIAVGMFGCAYIPSLIIHDMLRAGIIIVITTVIAALYVDFQLIKIVCSISTAVMISTVIFYPNFAYKDVSTAEIIKSLIIILVGYLCVGMIVKNGKSIIAKSDDNANQASILYEQVNEKMENTEKLQKIQRNISQQVKEVSEKVENSAKGIHEIVDSLSCGSTRQASAIEELTVTVDEISEKSNENKSIANELSSLTKQTANNVIIGSEQMQNMLQAMNDIKLASEKINSIVKDISMISFQTNILALNASVEAARAGEVGKGFSVVADEVRNLSAKTAQAVNNTNKVIENTFEAVLKGEEILNKTAIAFEDINNNTKHTSSLVLKIVDSSTEQTEAIKQVAAGMNQISEVVQNNVATAEESAASTQVLFNEVMKMNNIVKKLG